MQYDLLIKNGYVVDYASAREGYFDVAVQNGMIAAVESSIGGSAVRELDVAYLPLGHTARDSGCHGAPSRPQHPPQRPSPRNHAHRSDPP